MQQYNCYNMFCCSLCSCKKHGPSIPMATEHHCRLAMLEKSPNNSTYAHTLAHFMCCSLSVYALTLYLIHFFFGFGKVRICAILRLLTLWYERIMKKRTEGWSITEMTHKIIPSTLSCYRIHYPYLHKQTHTRAHTHAEQAAYRYLHTCLCVLRYRYYHHIIYFIVRFMLLEW